MNEQLFDDVVDDVFFWILLDKVCIEIFWPYCVFRYESLNLILKTEPGDRYDTDFHT